MHRHDGLEGVLLPSSFLMMLLAWMEDFRLALSQGCLGIDTKLIYIHP